MASIPQPTVNMACPECGSVLRTQAGWRLHRRRVHGVVPTEKECTRCKRMVPLLEYKPAHRPGTYSSWCRKCISEQANAWRRGDRPESHIRRDKHKNIKSYLGISVEHYYMLWDYFMDRQGGVCAICGGEPDRMDHCHETGRMRGLLCRECNLALGFLKDDVESAQRLLNYLQRMG